MTNSKTATFSLTPETIEELIAQYLYSIPSLFPDGRDILFIDTGLPINDEGFVEIDVEYVEYDHP